MGDHAEIAALREVLKSRTAALEAIAKGPAVDEDDAAFAKQAQELARAALEGDSGQ